MTVLLVLAALAAVVGIALAARRCCREIRAARARARRRADAALILDRAGAAWDAHTGRLATALAPVLDPNTPAALSATTGFGDALVAEERLRTALASLHPRPVEESF